MPIDVVLLSILRARGMSERRIAAITQTLFDRDASDGNRSEARNLLAEALASTGVVASCGIIDFDAAIATGLKFASQAATRDGWTEADMSVTIRGAIPETAAAVLRGRPLRDLIDHPLLPGDALITDVTIGEVKTIVRLRPERRPAGEVPRIGPFGLLLERCSWRLRRHADACEAGTLRRLTHDDLFIAVAILGIGFLLSFVAIAIVGDRFPLIIPFLILALVIGAPAAYLLAITLMEDRTFASKVDEMRAARIRGQRRAILEGGTPPAIAK